MKRILNKVKHEVFIVACMVVAVFIYLYFIAIDRPFESLNANTVTSVEITSIMRSDGNMVLLDAKYASQVIHMLSSIETHPFQDPLNKWKDGSVTHMFTVTLTTGESIKVGENYPNVVINDVPYRITIKAQAFLSSLTDLYRSHPDHCPCG